MQYLVSLFLTLLLEEGLALLWGVRGRDLLLVALVNVLTNPLVVLTHNALLPYGVVLHTVLPEILAVAAEAFLYLRRENRIPHPALFAVTANLLSYATGQWIALF